MTDQEDDSQLPKRRRVARACDECRRKKIRCDGRSPCTHCTVYSYKCTFDQPSNRRRNPPPGYVHQLEQKCDRYEQLLKKFAPHIDLEVAPEESFGADDPARLTSQSSGSVLDYDATSSNDNSQSMDSMLQKLELNRDSMGNIDFRGTSSGTIFVQSVCGQVGWSTDPNSRPRDVYGGAPSIERPEGSPQEALSAVELSSAVKQQKLDSPNILDVDEEIQMPPYRVALALSRLCFERGCVVFQINHLPSYYSRLSDCYDPAKTGNDEDFVPVVYSAMAVGCLFVKLIEDSLEIHDPRLRAFQYFQASKKLSDTIDRANSDVLQTLLLQVLFLQSTCNMSLCWTYCGLALRNAQRMGLHRNFDDHFSPIERQLRKKQFWSIRAVELYLHAILGLPKGISEDDIDQGHPLEVDDEYLDSSGFSSQPDGVISTIVSANAYSRLGPLLSDIVSQVYPTHDAKVHGGQSKLSHEMLKAFETRLNQWDESLPSALQHTSKFGEVDIRFYRQSRILRYCYYHLYVLMYRPFLQYLRTDDEDSRKFRVYGEKAKQGALGALRVTEDMLENDPTGFGHFFAIYSTFFSGLIVLYCVIQEQPPVADRSECLRYIEVAKTAMQACQPCSFAAESGLSLINEISRQIPPHDDANSGTPNHSESNGKSRRSRTSGPMGKKEETSKSQSPRRASTSQRPLNQTSRTKERTVPQSDDPKTSPHGFLPNAALTGQDGSEVDVLLNQAAGSTYNTGTAPNSTTTFMPTFPNLPMTYSMQQGFPSPQFFTQDTYQPHADRFGNLNSFGYFFDQPQGTGQALPLPRDMYVDAIPQTNPAFFFAGAQWPYGSQMPQQNNVNMMQYEGVDGMELHDPADAPMNMYYPHATYEPKN